MSQLQYKEDIEKSDIFYAKHESHSIVEGIRSVVNSYFVADVDLYCKLPIDDYREITRECQRTLCSADYVRKIATEIHDDLVAYMKLLAIGMNICAALNELQSQFIAYVSRTEDGNLFTA